MRLYTQWRLIPILACVLLQFLMFRRAVTPHPKLATSTNQHGSLLPNNHTMANNETSRFGACLLVKDDNDMLYEWIAYHYTVLPLSYLVIGSDINSTQDPSDVLSRWTKAGVDDFQYRVMQPEQFIHRYGNHDDRFGTAPLLGASTEQLQQFHHHALMHRQKGFISACAEFLQRQGVGWTLFTDTDEFIALNQLSEYDNAFEIGGSGPFAVRNDTYALRRDVLGSSRSALVSEVIDALQTQVDLGPCYTMPRLLVGPIENKTCPEEYGVEPIQEFARQNLGDQYKHMSTLRFHRHAKKGDFEYSRFGKVMIDLSRIPTEIIQTEARHIHRPFYQFCRSAGSAHFPDSFFFLMHYLGSWERYAARSDGRRDLEKWRRYQTLDFDHSACSSTVFAFLPRFFQRVGTERAQYLLQASTIGHEPSESNIKVVDE